VALALAVGSMLVAFSLAPPVAGATGIGVDLPTAALLLAASLPVVILFSALEMSVCLAARSFKEAQNYIVPMQFAVLIPAMAVMVLPSLAPPLAAFAVPVFSTLVVLRDLFLGRVEPTGLTLMAGSSVAYAAGAVGLAIWQFGRERVLFRV
jgi:sodium transport system permease protein